MKSEKVGFWNEKWKKYTTPTKTKKKDYYISDFGRMKSVDKFEGTENLLKGSQTKMGYLQLNIRLENGKSHGIYIHKYVAHNFTQRPSEDHIFILHKDEDKLNNHKINLVWMTREELTKDQIRRGVYDRGGKHPHASHVKMTDTKVKLLKQRLKLGKTKRKVLAKMFNISTMQLSRIERGENWGHVSADD